MKKVQIIFISMLRFLPLILTITPIVLIIIFINLPSDYSDYSIPVFNIAKYQVKDFVYYNKWIFGLIFVTIIIITIVLRLIKQKCFAEEISLILGLFPAMLYSIYFWEFVPH